MGRTNLDFQLKRAKYLGNSAYIESVASLRIMLFKAALAGDWATYNEVREGLNHEGAQIPYRPFNPPETQEQLTMGMFDKPQYLTGKNPGDGFVDPGDTFWLHNARLDGTSNVNGQQRDQVKLLVSHEKDGEKTVVYTTGLGIVNQVKRMDKSDRDAMPLELRLDQIPSGKGNPTNVLTPADQDPPTGGNGGDGVTDF